MIKLLLFGGVGTLIGAVMGTLGTCESSGCPLTANPWRGSLFGAAIGLALGFGAIGGSEATAKETGKASALISISSEKQFKSEVLKSDIPVLVDFYADWCPPCKRMLPVMEKLAETWKGKVKIVKINVDNNQQLTQRYKISGIPDVRFFNKGKEVNKFTGFRDEAFWTDQLTKLTAGKK
ncbi:MAG: thioredoxin [Victivallales bacterium]|nr:thioredoxin [Victivallales bacterium]